MNRLRFRFCKNLFGYQLKFSTQIEMSPNFKKPLLPGVYTDSDIASDSDDDDVGAALDFDSDWETEDWETEENFAK